MSIKQYDLFVILIPQNFKNIKYSKENLYLENKKNTLQHYKHKLEIYDVSDNDYSQKHLHEIYFFEAEKYKRKYFPFNENLEKINIYFKIDIHNNSETFKSIIPLLNIDDFKNVCNNFGINLIEKNQTTLIENELNNLSISNNVIFVDSKPIIKLNHKKHLAIVSNVKHNVTFETKLYEILMKTLNLCGSSLNILRDELYTQHFDNIDEKIIDNVILKLQSKLDVSNNKNE